ncbi:hypothetical protein HYQ21_gp056 [Acinetobacter phage vB_AbaM_Apostate]|uniref:Uncharacterized protein n=1 Tax=Acinetobacter phage vB_AbaM_Apostate TaxID=2686308 RepID=A0A6B9J8G0_9CAUD|nr:hypothetical protein HYQ21_gp056 [Acinetobacter phage vB_AbaM_Apostate]QGZ15647.1 hypothetical protein Apostate_056 [Acinetobacter phage vB_AbaM_Apostate]
MKPDQLAILQETIQRLHYMKDHFGDLVALKSRFGTSITIFGVCNVAYLDALPHINIDIISIIKSWPLIYEGNIAYPIAGKQEYNSSYRLVWTNPRRLEFIEYIITQLEKIETVAKAYARSLEDE